MIKAAVKAVRTWAAGLRAGRQQRRILVGLCSLQAGLLAYSAAIHSPVVDEPAHLAAGLSHWRRGDFSLYRVNPPLVRMVATAPLLLTAIDAPWDDRWTDLASRGEFGAGEELVARNGSLIFSYATIARLPCLAFPVLGTVVCFAWARLLFGKVAALCAAALWCFSPMILGHGSLLTPDVAGTALGAGACYAFARWLAQPSWSFALLAGVALGLAECAKSTWIILVPLLAVIWLIFRVAAGASGTLPKAGQLASILALAWAMLIAIYGGKGLGEPLGSIPLQSRLARSLLGSVRSDGEFRIRPVLAHIPLPLPRDYLVGIDRQWSDLEGPERSFLRGEWRMGGWWHYYAYGLAVKEPLGSQFLAGLALLFWIALATIWISPGRLCRSRGAKVRAFALLLLVPATVFGLASMNTGMNHHVRYVMPVLPFLYIAGAGLAATQGPWRTARTATAGVLAGSMAISSLTTYPHSLSYFNEAAGGARGGIHQLDNSNLDWGQDLLLLADWKRSHAPHEPIFLAYFGRVNPLYAGIDFQLPPPYNEPTTGSDRRPNSLGPGWYAISATLLQGREYFVYTPDGGRRSSPPNAVAYFSQYPVADRVGYSIYLFRFRDEPSWEQPPDGNR